MTQLATACVVAARAESPVVAFVGERPAKDPNYHQGLNQSRFADGVETGFIRLNTGDFADEAVGGQARADDNRRAYLESGDQPSDEADALREG